MSAHATVAAPSAAPAPAAAPARPPARAGSALRLGRVDDPAEREADRVADALMAGSALAALPPLDPGGTVRRACVACAKDDDEQDGATVRRTATATGPASVPASVPAAIAAPGQPLPAAERAFFEPRLGRDLSGVRIHTGMAAQRSAAAIDALAYTAGQDVAFAAGQWAPGSAAGRRLLAHELAHIAQGGAAPTVRRACSPAALAATSPRFFPRDDTTLRDVFSGAATMTAGASGEAVAMLQQALIVLGHLTGTTGPGRDGADGSYGGATTAAVNAFQVAEGLAPATFGTVDRATMRCLDDHRAALPAPVFFPQEPTLMRIFTAPATLTRGANQPAVALVRQALIDLGHAISGGAGTSFNAATETAVKAFQSSVPLPDTGIVDRATLRALDTARLAVQRPPNQAAAGIPLAQFQVESPPGGRDQRVFFARGSHTVTTAAQLAPITAFVAAHRCHFVRLLGFASEDEIAEFGPALVDRRIATVAARLAVAGHGAGVPPCVLIPVRIPEPHAADSAGVIDYRRRRLVELVPGGTTPQTLGCPPTAPRHRPLTAAEQPVFDAALTRAIALVDGAIAALVVGNATGDDALRAFFGGTTRRAAVRSKLTPTWRDHLDGPVRSRNRRGVTCDSTCAGAIAYNVGTGGSAMMTVCDSFFSATNTVYPATTSKADERALVLAHEAGHGSIGSEDFAYDTNRLVHFLQTRPTLALTNTDSFISLIRCIAGMLGSPCALPVRGDNAIGGLSAADLVEAQRGLAWLETWLILAGQDSGGVYAEMQEARGVGRWRNSYYANRVWPLLATAFAIRSPAGALPTFREQTTVAALWDRLRDLERASGRNIDIDRVATDAAEEWLPAAGVPGTVLHLGPTFFARTSDRGRVDQMLPLLIRAHPGIDPGFRAAYRAFVRNTVRDNWGNNP